MARLPGHGLLYEGAAVVFSESHLGEVCANGTRWKLAHRGGEGIAACRCGEWSPRLPSDGARRRWHKDHKNDVFARTTLEGMSL